VQKTKEKILSIPFVDKFKNKVTTEFKKNFKRVMLYELVNIYGEARIGGLSKVKTPIYIKQNIRQNATGYYNVLCLKENDMIMLLDTSYTIDKIQINGNKTELNFWFTILVNGTKTHYVCARQFITFYKQNSIICLFD